MLFTSYIPLPTKATKVRFLPPEQNGRRGLCRVLKSVFAFSLCRLPARTPREGRRHILCIHYPHSLHSGNDPKHSNAEMQSSINLLNSVAGPSSGNLRVTGASTGTAIGGTTGSDGPNVNTSNTKRGSIACRRCRRFR